MLSCGVRVMSTGFGTTGIMITAFLFGFTSFPIYSVAAAHAQDFADDSERVELSAALVLFLRAGCHCGTLRRICFDQRIWTLGIVRADRQRTCPPCHLWFNTNACAPHAK